MKTFFTVDTHFNHKNIIEYAERPFKSLDHMNNEIIRRWNQRVEKHDFVIFLGDFAFKDSMASRESLLEILSQLKGHITFIRGNHDNNNSLSTKAESIILEFDNKAVYCTHNPEDYSSSYPINLTAHVHQNWKIKRVYRSYLVNVGVDVWNFYPIPIDDILKAISDFKKEDKLLSEVSN